MRFRPDIEGLRGVAVLMVVLAHAGVPGFLGGFVGVDVFFVISGFLITGLLKRELEGCGRIRFTEFYAKRVRRLLPALVVMLAGTMMLGLWLLPASAWSLQADSMRWAALWAANIHFATTNFGYFGPSATDSLYLHTWSLGVEEQFYLIWPAVLAGLWFVGDRRALRSGVLLMVLGGFALSVAASQIWPVHAYYQTPFRIWQLAAGGLLHFAGGGVAVSGLRARLLRSSGLVVLAYCCYGLAPTRAAYPGLWALLPTLATLLLLVPAKAGSPDHALENPLFRFLGRLSYSWYLWHWPLMVLAASVVGRDAVVGLGAGLVALVPAWLSWRFVELQRPREITRPLLWVLAGLAGSLLIVLVALGWSARAPGVTASPGAQASSAVSIPALYNDPACDEWYSAARVVPCMRVNGARVDAPTVVLVGDSVGAQWSPAFEIIANEQDWRLVVLTKSSCPILDRPFFYERIRRRFVECEVWRDGVVDYLRGLRPTMLVIGSTAGYGDAFSASDWESGTRDLLRRLRGSAESIRIIVPTPILSFDARECVASGGGRRFPDCSQALEAVDPTAITGALERAASGEVGVEVVDLNNLVCPDGMCAAFRDGVLTYRDSQHLDAVYVERLADGVRDAVFKAGPAP